MLTRIGAALSVAGAAAAAAAAAENNESAYCYYRLA